MFGNNLPKSSRYGILSVMLTMRKTLSLACGKATPQPPAAWRRLMLACLHDVSIKDSVMFYVSMWEQSTWTSWVHTKHWYPKHQEKLQKNQKTYRNLCKLPISANDNYLELAMISSSFSVFQHPGRICVNKKTHRKKKFGRKNPSNPLSPGSQQTAVPAGAARDFGREDGALSAARPEPQAALTNSREVCMAGKAETTWPPGFGWQKNQEPRVYWQRSWAKRHGKNLSEYWPQGEEIG